MVTRTRPEGGGWVFGSRGEAQPSAECTRDNGVAVPGGEIVFGRGVPPGVFVSADSKEVTGGFLVSADSKGFISPLFPADPRGDRKCGL